MSYEPPLHESVPMALHGFEWDPTFNGRARWTHTATGITALRQPFMTEAQWLKHTNEKIKEAERAARESSSAQE